MKKGFTLIEMLGIIAVLAVVLLVTFPVLNNSLKNMKEDQNENFLKNLKISTEAYIELNRKNYPELDEIGSTTITINDLYNAELLKGNYNVDKSNQIIITKKEDNTLEYTYINSNDIMEYTFDYTGNVQEFTVPKDGLYKIETWGAQGGDFQINSNNFKAGYGGYSNGYMNLNKNTSLYIVVGKKGEHCETTNKNTSCSASASYNGGGGCSTLTGYSSDLGVYACGAGGGATHIAINSNLGELKNYNNNRNDIAIVSGGGGGAQSANAPYNYGYGGSAGGYKGITNENKGNDIKIAAAGTQTSGSAFGSGAYNGGGSGYYGGQATITGGAGGSSYIGNPLLIEKSMYCYGCEESNEVSTFTVSTTGTSPLKDITNCPDGYSENPVSKCAKAGNGYARITYLGEKM